MDDLCWRFGSRAGFVRLVMRILIASSSDHRQGQFREAIEGLGHQVLLAKGALECVERLRQGGVELMILEAPLLWGGAEGVLEVAQCDGEFGRLPVILVAVGVGTIDWFQLGRFRVDDLLFRVPTTSELSRAIGNVVARTNFQPRASAALGT
jgi:hypothetical protein